MKIRTAEEKKKLNSRLNRISGQINGIAKMIEDDKYCPDILIQLSACEKAIHSLAAVILENHLHSCVISSIENKDYTVVDEIMDLFKKY